MLNQCQFIGRLGSDPEVRRLAGGEPVVNFRLAVSEKWRNKSGEKQERTEWVPVVIFNENLAKVAESYLRKGSRVFVSGKLQTREWQDKDGQKRYSTEIVLQRFRGELTILDGIKEGDASLPNGDPSKMGSGSVGGGQPAGFDDDVHF